MRLSPEQALRQPWHWYWVLVIANALDLLFTYTAAERGIDEANVILRPVLLTPWPPLVKLAALALLAAGLTSIIRARRNPSPALRMVRLTAWIYLSVVIFHLLGLYLAS
ncbi:MAG: hypothetical protein XU14_C0060G0001 [Armatimonadetes bacterium CSP1-3]|nr:MAG: hypothetical protein XU14_C0060G0001 [Armatimonadetes bacterium CSP1-3]